MRSAPKRNAGRYRRIGFNLGQLIQELQMLQQMHGSEVSVMGAVEWDEITGADYDPKHQWVVLT